jgi:SAM-dependent methyltransferase
VRGALGLDVNPEMLAAAIRAPGIEYRQANALHTGLPGACGDIVTCAQSFHWMEAGPTIAEIARILRSDGLFTAYDYDWPPLIGWEVDAAFVRVMEAAGVDPSRPEKERHVETLKASGRFRAVREVLLHARQVVRATDIARLPLVFGPVARRLGDGMTEHDLGLDRLREAAGHRFGADATVAWWSYRVRLAVK